MQSKQPQVATEMGAKMGRMGHSEGGMPAAFYMTGDAGSRSSAISSGVKQAVAQVCHQGLPHLGSQSGELEVSEGQLQTCRTVPLRLRK